jgi:hypothetical protein
VDLDGNVLAEALPNVQYLGGYAQTFLDAGNTLSMTRFSLFDASGNPLPQSALASGSGYDYTSNTDAPEPASAFLFACAGMLLALASRLGDRFKI